MKCFYHPESDAVGICKACAKGVCPACAVDVGGGLACRESCVERVTSLNQLISRNLRATSVNKRATYLWPGFFFAMGCVFIGGPYFSTGRTDTFTLVMGGLFVALGLYLAVLNRAVRGST
jgi:hypothetical protein